MPSKLFQNILICLPIAQNCTRNLIERKGKLQEITRLVYFIKASEVILCIVHHC